MEVAGKGFEGLLHPFDVNLHAGVAVQDPSIEGVSPCQAEHKRPEADTLNHASHLNPARQPFRASVGRHDVSG